MHARPGALRAGVKHTQAVAMAMELGMRCACANNIDQTAKCHLHSIVIVAAAFVVVVDVAISTPPLSPLLPLPGRHRREGERERAHDAWHDQEFRFRIQAVQSLLPSRPYLYPLPVRWISRGLRVAHSILSIERC